MRQRRHAGIFLAVAVAMSVLGTLPITNATASTTITVNGSGAGRSFQGIGGVSAGAAARLLNDYPGTQQSQILDYLFRCDTTFCGANLQRLKIEIGGDENSTWGAEPSIRRSGESAPGFTSDSVQCRRGYEFALMKAAITRNSGIKLDALEWGAPGWIGTHASPYSPNFWSQDNADYVNDLIDCAAQPQNQVNGSPLPISTVGLWNETGWSSALGCGTDGVNYVKSYLYPTLQSRHSSTAIVAADSPSCCVVSKNATLTPICADPYGWAIAPIINSDSTLAADVAYLGAHYQTGCGSDTACQTSLSTAQGLLATHGQYLWSSENTDDLQSQAAALAAGRGPVLGETAAGTAQVLNRDYLTSKQTATLLCCLIDAWFPSIYHDVGLIKAQSPWGNASYAVLPQLWVVAHTTQFTRIGWQYLDGAQTCLGVSDCTSSSATGSVVTLKSAGSCPSSCPDFSSIVETTDATTTQSLTFNLSNVHSLGCGCVHVWKSDLGAGTYLQESDYSLSGGSSFTLPASPNSVYTITTTSWGKLGSYTQNSESAFPFPWSDNFQSATVGGLPRYLSDQHGAFEIQPCDGGQTGNCVEQVVTTPPICWTCTGPVVSVNTFDSHYNNFTGKIGMVYKTGAGGVTITQLGRYSVSGNTQAHTLSVYLDSNHSLISPTCSVNTSTATVVNGFQYCALSSPIALSANTTYDIVSSETETLDSWYYYPSTTVSVYSGSVPQAIYQDGGGTWGYSGVSGNSYGPVNFVASSNAAEVTPTTILGRRGPSLPPYGVPASNGSLDIGSYTLSYTYVTSSGETEPSLATDPNPLGPLHPNPDPIVLDSTHRQISVSAVTPLPGYATAVKWYFNSGPTTGFTVQNNGSAFTLNTPGNFTAPPTGDYTIESQVLWEQAGTAGLLGRVQDGLGGSSYEFDVSDQGAWSLQAGGNTIASGTVTAPGTGTWHTMEMNFSGSTIKVYWDDTTHPINGSGGSTDTTYSTGGVGFATGWNKVQFRASCWMASIGPC